MFCLGMCHHYLFLNISSQTIHACRSFRWLYLCLDLYLSLISASYHQAANIKLLRFTIYFFGLTQTSRCVTKVGRSTSWNVRLYVALSQNQSVLLNNCFDLYKDTWWNRQYFIMSAWCCTEKGNLTVKMCLQLSVEEEWKPGRRGTREPGNRERHSTTDLQHKWQKIKLATPGWVRTAASIFGQPQGMSTRQSVTPRNQSWDCSVLEQWHSPVRFKKGSTGTSRI